ncbi:MAG: hypothetical protein QME66_03750 [Candidatus Eisenbacteria bacterium]|nr:hypothetical protein [Candidatus Eisenbacteria bacterium]
MKKTVRHGCVEQRGDYPAVEDAIISLKPLVRLKSSLNGVTISSESELE